MRVTSRLLWVQLVAILLMMPVSLGCGLPGDKPLLLSKFLDRNEPCKARRKSRVDPSCLEDFVPPSHSGFLTVDKTLGNHLFFWFFPASENPNAPLLLWLNGGPTYPSMLGLFYEHGPMKMRLKNDPPQCGDDDDDDNEGEGTYTERKYSWTKTFSMLYVDNPVGTGFSFSERGIAGYRFTEQGYTGDLVCFLKQFLRIFPEYRSREIYLGGQSYAGKYIVALASTLHNELENGVADAISFTGIYLGGPLFDHEIQNLGLRDYLYNAGIVTRQRWMDLETATQKLYQDWKANGFNNTAIDVFENVFYGYIFHAPLLGSIFNWVTTRAPPLGELPAFMNQDRIKSAAHAGNRNYSAFDLEIFKMYRQDLYFVSVKSKLSELMDNYKVLVYNGAYDMRVSAPTVEAVLTAVPWSLQREYNASQGTPWKVGPEGTTQLAGYYSHVGKLCRVTVMKAGHYTPVDTPLVALTMMEQFVFDGCVSDRVVMEAGCMGDEGGEDEREGQGNGWKKGKKNKRWRG